MFGLSAPISSPQEDKRTIVTHTASLSWKILAKCCSGAALFGHAAIAHAFSLARSSAAGPTGPFCERGAVCLDWSHDRTAMASHHRGLHGPSRDGNGKPDRYSLPDRLGVSLGLICQSHGGYCSANQNSERRVSGDHHGLGSPRPESCIRALTSDGRCLKMPEDSRAGKGRLHNSP
jgi:hypothetical protein